MKNSQVARWGTAAFVIGSIVSTYFFSGPRRRGSSTRLFEEQQRPLDQNLTTPANATFALVWPVIYTGTVGLALHQASPAGRDNGRYAAARPWWLASYALNLAFGYFFSRPDQGSRVGASVTTIATLPAALGLHYSLGIGRTDVPQPERTLRRSVSLYAGWLTAATVVSAGNLFIEAGWRPRLAVAARWASGVLPVTTAVGLVVARRLNDPYYLAPFVAAFGGIAAKQWGKAIGVAVVSGACAVVTTAAISRRLPVRPEQLAGATVEATVA
jgi:tryptophan-rich sensory protein